MKCIKYVYRTYYLHCLFCLFLILDDDEPAQLIGNFLCGSYVRVRCSTCFKSKTRRNSFYKQLSGLLEAKPIHNLIFILNWGDCVVSASWGCVGTLTILLEFWLTRFTLLQAEIISSSHCSWILFFHIPSHAFCVTTEQERVRLSFRVWNARRVKSNIWGEENWLYQK